jgi:prepilin-type N-terminal cleavage/methylation domain-containing protein
MQKNNGFTIVELLIVIVVIGILAAITMVAYNNIKAQATDAERKTDIDSVSKALAQFRIDNEYYPRYDDIAANTQTWIKANLPGIKSDAFVAPGGTDGNSFGNSTGPAINAYSYRPYFDTDAGVQTVCTQTNLNNNSKTVESCTRYELRWRSEQDNSITMMRSRFGW